MMGSPQKTRVEVIATSSPGHVLEPLNELHPALPEIRSSSTVSVRVSGGSGAEIVPPECSKAVTIQVPSMDSPPPVQAVAIKDTPNITTAILRRIVLQPFVSVTPSYTQTHDRSNYLADDSRLLEEPSRL